MAVPAPKVPTGMLHLQFSAFASCHRCNFHLNLMRISFAALNTIALRLFKCISDGQLRYGHSYCARPDLVPSSTMYVFSAIYARYQETACFYWLRIEQGLKTGL